MKNRPFHRPLRHEQLETRVVFSADAVFPHNFVFPEDCDGSGDVSPLDALALVNAINRGETDAGQLSAETIDQKMLDVNADGRLSPIDALVVINHLNRPNVIQGSETSGVPAANRIARIQAAIESGQLPIQFDLDTAREILTTLQAGGRPETGERFMEGQLCPADVVDHILNERAAIELTMPFPDRDPERRVSQYLDHFEDRLNAAGIDEQVVQTIVSEIRTGIESGTPLTLAQIQSRLTELGVDISALFPVRPENPNPPDANPGVGRRLQEWVDRLRAAGVNADVINTIVDEIRVSIDAGSPLTLNQIKTRLTELGVDLSSLFPNVPPPNDHPPGPTPRIELVTRILQRARVAPATIEIVRNAMLAANEAGDPLTVREILEILRQNRVRLASTFVRLISQ